MIRKFNHDIFQTAEHRLQACGASTGHTIKTVAMCETASLADFLLTAVGAYENQAELLEMAKWAEAAIAPFSKEPADRSGITRLRAAIAKAEGRS